MFYPPSMAATYLGKLPTPQARAQFNDRVARAFLADDGTPQGEWEFKRQLAYNAMLATELRVRDVPVWA